jgi:acetyl esterase
MARTKPGGAGGTLAERRAAQNAAMALIVDTLIGPGPDVASVADYQMPVDGGEIVVRVYVPDLDAGRPGGACLYFHGGGFWFGTLYDVDPLCRTIAAGARCVVASVDYRLAPEHRFPVGVEDGYAALTWLERTGDRLGVDRRRLAVGGISAGANLAAAISLMARDRTGPRIALQILEMPPADLTMSCASVDRYGDGYFLTKDDIRDYRALYLRGPEDATHPYVSPMLADDVSSLPPALIMTAEFDPLRDEGETYARRLADAGTEVSLIRWPGHIHGSPHLASVFAEDNAAYVGTICSALRGMFREQVDEREGMACHDDD